MAPDRGEDEKPKGEHEQSEDEPGSLLPFVLIIGITLFIGADRFGFIGELPFEFSMPSTDLTSDSFSARVVATAASTVLVQQADPQDTTLAATNSRAVESVVTPKVEDRRMSSEGGNPQHNAMLFLFNAIILGVMITQLLHFRWFRCLQQTVVLFLCGVAYSLLLEGLDLHEHWGVFGSSYNMWMAIDPHLLLFTMLPPLLAGDAMSMDTAIARRVSTQWLYLAGPGVLINGFLTALFLWSFLPYDWPFLLCLTTGAILCATDPVAVVALLKELGAPPALTVQIQGESLLNDGTAIVLYQLTYNMLQGEQYDGSDIFVFFVKTAACAWCLGLAIGWIFYGWIRAASNKLEHHSAVIQISLTLCCAYWSFIMSEGIFHMSGVLATVASSLVLADKMWPLIVCKESMHTVWHMFEYLGNVIVFFLAGALTGKLMVHMPLRDYFYLIVIYMVLMLIRGAMLLCSRPIMNFMAKRCNDGDSECMLSVSDCLVMTWGGLRGAVGLALAIQVSVDKAGGEISELNANRVLFYTGGVAALTLIINATSCPALVKFLRIAQMPETKRRVLLIVYEQLVEKVRKFKSSLEFENLAVEDLDYAVKVVGDWIEKQGVERSLLNSNLSEQTAANAQIGRTSTVKMVMNHTASFVEEVAAASRAVDFAKQAVGRLKKAHTEPLGDNLDIVNALEEAKSRLAETPLDSLALLGDIADLPLAPIEADLCKTICTAGHIDPDMVRAMQEVHLNLVHTNYWKFIEAGDVVAGTNEAEVLLSSIKLSLGSKDVRLNDLKNIQKFIEQEERLRNSRTSLETGNTGGAQSELEQFQDEAKSRFHGWRRSVQILVDSTAFQGFIMFAIMSNAVFIALEDYHKSDTNQADIGWIVADCVFAGVFLVEFLLKFISLCSAYFKETWNIIDFTLVVVGIGSIILNMLAKEFAKHHDVAGESRLVRLARVLRVLRLMRVFRLLAYGRAFMARVVYRMEFSRHVAERVQNITILNCFIRAHLSSQQEILFFFGRDGRVEMPELARVIVESMVEVYQAVEMTVSATMDLDRSVVHSMNVQKRSKALAENLDAFVQGANEKGVITAREAEKLLKPVHRHLRKLKSKISKVHLGYVRSRSQLHDRSSCSSEDSDGDGDGAPEQGYSAALACWQNDGHDLLASDHGFLVTRAPSTLTRDTSLFEVGTHAGYSSRGSVDSSCNGFKVVNPRASVNDGKLRKSFSTMESRLSVNSALNGNGLNGSRLSNASATICGALPTDLNSESQKTTLTVSRAQTEQAVPKQQAKTRMQRQTITEEHECTASSHNQGKGTGSWFTKLLKK